MEQKKTTAKRIAFPNPLLREVLHACEKENCTFSAWVQKAVTQALQDLCEAR